jgi:hypothetical protein
MVTTSFKLDWDYITLKEAGKRMGRIFDAFGVYPKLCRTRSGFHCYFTIDKLVNPDDKLTMRLYFQDDPRRVALDRNRLSQGVGIDVLFQDYEEEVPFDEVRKLVNTYSFIMGA